MESNDSVRVDDKNPSSSIAKHLVETGHKIDVDLSFVALYKVVQGCIMGLTGALSVRKWKPLFASSKTVCSYPKRTLEV